MVQGGADQGGGLAHLLFKVCVCETVEGERRRGISRQRAARAPSVFLLLSLILREHQSLQPTHRIHMARHIETQLSVHRSGQRVRQQAVAEAEVP